MPGWQGGAVKRLYVEPFVTRAGAEELRGDVIAELSRQTSVSLVSTESGADAILGGGGEIWVKGYRSLNPRSGRQPSAGKPVFGGFLSVELRDARGETLWSYLVTPGPATEDVSKELAKRIARRLLPALETTLQKGGTARAAAPPRASVTLKGAGATFPYPVYAKWFINYGRENPNLDIAYDPAGSEAGVRRLLAGEVDFGASDNPEAIREIAPGEQSRFLFLPSVVGAVVPIVNLPGFTGEVSFTPEALAGIYLGKIKRWNDPVIRQSNRGVRLPDLEIVVVHRADGSGTSYAWTDYLSRTNPEWKASVGAGLSPKWPTGRAAGGNEGVARLVRELGGSIGYVEFNYALRNHLICGKVRNRHGEFVEASLESMALAVGESAVAGEDPKVSLADPPGAGAYPIASFTWLVVPVDPGSNVKRSSLKGFLTWMLGPGQTQAAALGYLALPRELVSQELAAIARLR